MANLGELLIQKEEFSQILMGNVAIVRAMVESGVRVVSSYPGSPTPEIAEAIKTIKKEERPFYFEFSLNEKVATELAFGSAINGHLSVVFFKSVGLNVAADSFVQLPLMDIPGGMVVILGDDPGANSSQNEQDNRHYARLSYMPLFEPACVEEVYSMFKKAAALARELRSVVIFRLTTHVCHAKEYVKFASLLDAGDYDWTPRFDSSVTNYIPIGATVFPMKKRALERIIKLEKQLPRLGFDRLVDNKNPAKGIITAGLPFASIMDTLQYCTEKPDVLKLGAVYPFDRELVAEFLEKHGEVKIMEELDPVLEAEIKALAFEKRIDVKIISRASVDEAMGEYTPGKVKAILKRIWPGLFPGVAERAELKPITPRPAQLCPGCGHRSGFYAIKKALGPDDITVADIGCHTLGYLEPYKMGQVLLSMGHSTGTASGLSINNSSRRVVSFIGDSTFFHAGLPGITNAVYNNHPVLLIVMENGTTAMTGHQEHPGTGKSFNGEATKLTVRAALEGLGVTNIREIDTYKQKELTEMVKAALQEPGFKVIIARHPCMLKFTREASRKPGYVRHRVMIDQNICTRVNECIERFACPSFHRDDEGMITVQRDLCIGDGSCRQVCPEEAIVPEKNRGAN